MKWMLNIATAAFIFMGIATANADSAVRVDRPDGGHGSGVVMLDGRIITAAHVTNGISLVFVTTDQGTILNYKVARSFPESDVAILESLDTNVRIHGSHLSCTAPVVGEPIRASGNPLDLRNINFWGRVSGSEVNFFGRWKSITIVGVAGAAGMSGGPIFNDLGQIRGIVVAGPGAVAPFLIAVPSIEICRLLNE